MKNRIHIGTSGSWARGVGISALLLVLFLGMGEAWAQSPPSITQQPQNQTNNLGTTASFRVSATGASPLTYRWRKGTTNLVDGGRISGATTTNLTIANVQVTDAGNYSVIVSNPLGSISSATVTLTVQTLTNYTVNVRVGLNLIANQLDRGGNTLNEVLPNVPGGSRLHKFINANQVWQVAEYNAVQQSWQPGQITLNPGEGAFLESPSSYQLTFTGFRRNPVLPVNMPAGLCYLLSRQTPDPGTYDTIVGLTPRDGAVVHRWNAVAARYDTYSFVNATWQPTTPITAVGESEWICSQGGGVPNEPPVISDILNQTANEDTVIGPLPFLVRDLETPPAALVVSAASTNLALVPTSAIVFGGAGTNRTLTITPASNQSGTSLITVTVRDDSGATRSDSFMVTINAINDLPTISNIPDQTINEDGTTGPISFTIGDAETAAGSLGLTASSSSQNLVPLNNIIFGGSGSSRTVTVIPVQNQSGTSVITVTVIDGAGASTNDTFIVIVNQVNDLPTISNITDRTIPEDSTTGLINFTVGDLETVVGNLVLTAGSSNPGLVPLANIVFGGSGSNRTVTVTPALNQTGTNVITVTVTDSSGGSTNDAFILIVTPVNDLPSISNIPDQTIAEDTSTGPIVFVIADAETAAGNLTLGASTSNPGLVPLANIVFGGSGGNRTVTVTPASNQFGTNVVTVTVSDGSGASTNDSFVVIVNSVNDPPTISNIFDQTVIENNSTPPINFTVGDVETAPANLTLAATTSNPELVPMGNIVIGGSGANRTITVTPAPNQAGTNIVTVTVADANGASANDSFRVVITPRPPQLVRIDAICPETNVVITFNEPVDPVSSLSPSRYVIESINNNIVVLGVELTADPRVVSLRVNSSLSPQLSYNLTALVRGLRGNEGSSSMTFVCEPCVRGSSGKEFWLTFPGNYAVNPFAVPEPQLFITGDPGTTGTVSAPGLVPPILHFTIPVNRATTVTLPREADLGGVSDVVEAKGIHVTADNPIAVYGYNHMPHSTDAYLALPVRALGKAYIVMSYKNVFTDALDLNGVQFAMAATEDNTTVTIVPSTDVGGHPAKLPFELTLQRGETYQLIDTTPSPADLTGTLVFADKAIAVFGSHQNATITDADVFYSNHLVEQLPPTQMWGNEFVIVPFATRLGGDTFRLMALSEATEVRVNGVILSGLLNRGHFRELRLDKESYITATKPILVAQFAHSAEEDGVTDADPFMVLVPPAKLFGVAYTLQIPATGFEANYLNLVATAGTSVLLDGRAITTPWTGPIAGSGYVANKVPVTPGPHTLASANGTPLGAIAYGWNTYDSYGYPAGLCQTTLPNPPPSCDCPPRQHDAAVDSNCVARVADLSVLLTNCAAPLFVTQDPPVGQQLGPGTNVVITTIVDYFGDRRECVTLMSGAGLSGQDIVTNCVSPAGTIVTYPVPSCGAALSVTCDPPPGSLFASGVTTVTCVGTNQGGQQLSASFSVTVRCLSIGLDPSNKVVVIWSGGLLEAASNLTGPWAAVQNAASPFVVPLVDQQFYRVRFQ